MTVVGAGAVGTYLAVRTGAERVIVRGAKPEALRLVGAESAEARPRFETWEEARGISGVVLVTVKAAELEGTLDRLRPLAKDAVVVLCQNGILGETGFTRAACWLGVVREAPGVARVAGVHRIDVAGPHADEVAALLPKAQVVPDVRLCEWRKALWNVAVNGIASIAGVPNGAILESPRLRAIAERLLDETLAVAKAEGIALGTADREAVFRSIAVTAANLNATLQDLRAGRRTEIPWLNGAVARLGRARGIATPYNEFVVDLIGHLEDACRKTSP